MTGVKNILSKKQKPIIRKIQKGLLLVVIAAIVVTSIFVYGIEDLLAVHETTISLTNALDEMVDNINSAAEIRMLRSAKKIVSEIETGTYDLESLASEHDVSEINIFDANGIVVESTDQDIVGFDIRTGEQSMEFMCLYNGSTEYVQKMMPTADDSTVLKKFVGVTLGEGKGFVQIAYYEKDYHKKVNDEIVLFTENQKIDATGGVAVFEEDGEFVAISKTIGSIEWDKNYIDSTLDHEEGDIFVNTVLDTRIYEMYRQFEGYVVVAFITTEEAIFQARLAYCITLLILVLVFAAVYFIFYLMIKKSVVNEITKIAGGLNLIAKGQLEEKIEVRSSKEFSSLSDDINETVETLNRYIKEAAARFDKDLIMANTIQTSVLPKDFEIIKTKTGIDIFGIMCAAKEVGGDFYDFYLREENKLDFLIADVSGKGIPAAMFMMRAKAIIKEKIEHGYELDQAIFEANNELCTGNDEMMFVTVWQGELDITSGKVSFVRAGHDRPVIKRASGRVLFHKESEGFVLASYPDACYEKQELTLKHGDAVILYTDGVTEAKNSDGGFYGEDRLLDVVKKSEETTAEKLCNEIRKDVADFAGNAEQFDDITILAIFY